MDIRRTGRRIRPAICLLAVLMLVGAMGAWALAAEGEVVFHQAFNAPMDGLPEGWSGRGVIVADAREGAGSLLIVDDSDSVYTAVNVPPIAVEGDTDYAISVWTKTDDVEGDGSRIAVLIQEFNDANQRVGIHWLNPERSLDWLLTTLSITTLPETKSLRLILYSAAQAGPDKVGTAWFDELAIVKVQD